MYWNHSEKTHVGHILLPSVLGIRHDSRRRNPTHRAASLVPLSAKYLYTPLFDYLSDALHLEMS